LIPCVDLKAQYRSINVEIDAAIAAVLENGTFILGKHVAAFEEDFAAPCSGLNFPNWLNGPLAGRCMRASTQGSWTALA
jgi:hypothetical protein